MTMFETMLNETTTLKEALSLQPCLVDEISEYECEKIRAKFLEEWFNISVWEYIFMKRALDRKKAKACAKALADMPNVIAGCVMHGA